MGLFFPLDKTNPETGHGEGTDVTSPTLPATMRCAAETSRAPRAERLHQHELRFVKAGPEAPDRKHA